MKLSDALESEIAERMSIAADDEETLTRDDVLRMMVMDYDYPGTVAHYFRRELQNYGVHKGIFKAHTQQDLDRVTVSSGKKYEFKRNGVYYCFDKWI